MKTKINNSKLKAYKEIFNLNYSWQNKFPSSLAASLGLASLNNKINTGYLLAKQIIKLEKLPTIDQNLTIISEVTNTRQFNNFKYLTCQVKIQQTTEEIIETTTKLIKPDTIKQQGKQQIEQATAGPTSPWRKFSPQEVYQFSQYVNDPNPIHLSEQPIVPGMLILFRLENYLAQQNKLFKQAVINYLQPVYSNQQIKLVQPKIKELLGLVNNKQCFQLEFN